MATSKKYVKNKPMKITKHRELITYTMAYLRFKRQYPIVASEVFNKDVLFWDFKTNLFGEFEIKSSWADFKNDFKKEKHNEFENINSRVKSHHLNIWIPNYYSFVVSKEISEKAKVFLKDNYKKYGLFCIHSDGSVICIRKASKLIDKSKRHSRIMRNNILKRITSETITMRMLLERELK